MLRICAVFVLALLPFGALAGLAGPVRVIDGDTFDVGNERVRLFGIDAPEMDQTCKNRQGQAWACGVWVADQVRHRFGGQNVTCDRMDTDRYGRTVARCFVGNRDVADEIVTLGLAFAYRRYSTDYVSVERQAEKASRGLHASQVQSPAAFRAARTGTRTGTRQAASSPGCAIKGNISSRGTRIYHIPGQQNYERTRISAAKGERWFCTERAARNAGWRRARR